MKLDQFNLIVSQLQKNIVCPRCKNPILKEETDVHSFQEKDLELHSFCHSCNAQSTIFASIDVGSKKKSKSLANHNIDRQISLQAIQGLYDRLKNFNGNVGDLFKG